MAGIPENTSGYAVSQLFSHRAGISPLPGESYSRCDQQSGAFNLYMGGIIPFSSGKN